MSYLNHSQFPRHGHNPIFGYLNLHNRVPYGFKRINMSVQGVFTSVFSGVRVQPRMNHTWEEPTRDGIDSNPLHQAVMNKDIKMIRLLIQNGFDINGKNLEGQTPLFIATEMGYFVEMRALLELGALVDESDNFDRTPLATAAIKGHDKCCQLLVEFGATIDKVDSYGDTPLMLASLHGCVDICHILIEAGAKVNFVNKNGRTALSLTSFNRPDNYKAISNLLRRSDSKAFDEYRYIKYTKMLSLSYGITGLSTYNQDSNFKFQRERFSGIYQYRRFAKDINAFCAEFPNLIPKRVETELSEILNLEANSRSQKNHQIDRSRPLFVHTGYIGHYIVGLFFQDVLFLCNRGESKRKSMEIFRLPKELKVSVIDKLKNLSKEEKIEYENFIFKRLDQSCIPKNYLDIVLEDLISLGPQKGNNCCYASLRQAIFTYQCLKAFQTNKIMLGSSQEPLIRETINQQKIIYENFEAFQQLSNLERYLKFVSTHPHLLEKDLVLKALDTIQLNNLYPKLCEKHTELRQLFLNLISLNF